MLQLLKIIKEFLASHILKLIILDFWLIGEPHHASLLFFALQVLEAFGLYLRIHFIKIDVTF